MHNVRIIIKYYDNDCIDDSRIPTIADISSVLFYQKLQETYHLHNKNVI